MEKMDTFIRQESMNELSLGFVRNCISSMALSQRLLQDISRESEEKQIWQECLPKQGKRASLPSSQLYKSKMVGKEKASNPTVNKVTHSYYSVSDSKNQ